MITNKRIVSLLACTALAFSASAAEPKEAVGNAAKALKEKANYSWSTTSQVANSDFPAMTTKGKVEKDGLMFITSEGRNGEIQAAKKGDKGVLKTEEGWKTAEELQAAQGGQGRWFAGRLLTALAPAQDVEALLKGVKELKAGEAGEFSAELTPEAAKERTSFGRRRPAQDGATTGTTPPEPKDAKGSVKFWVKDGVLTKYELKTYAKVTIQGEEREMDRTATTTISDVGSTKVEVPEEAKKKIQ